MKKAEKIQAYFMRVDEATGQPYQGYLGEIENTLKAKQFYVNYGREGGLIQAVHLNDDVDIICHDEGKLMKFPFNRVWLAEDGKILDIFAGNILAVRHKGDGFAGILPSDVQEIQRYLFPVILSEDKNILVLPDALLPEYEGEYLDAGAD